MESAETLIVGAGQAGLALSRYLTRAGHDHVLLDRGRVGERWRSERWDSLALLTPNWLSELPGAPHRADPDGFQSRSGFVDYLERYASSFSAPVREGVSVLEVTRFRRGFWVETDDGIWLARNVVVATGYADEPRVPAFAAATPPEVVQLHTAAYRSPEQLPPGGVLVVGAGPSGQQIALELRRSGRQVAIAVGRHAPVPRRYRGSDILLWLELAGNLDQTIDEVPHLRDSSNALSLALTGANGGERLGLDLLAGLGVTVTGRLRGFSGGHALFADDLQASLAAADKRLRRALGLIDRYVEGLPARERPAAERVPPVALPDGPRTLDLVRSGVSTVIWATGYGRSYPWLDVDVLGDAGEVEHVRGVTAAPGLYALGLRFQHRRKSHFVGGVGDDARFLAARILAPARRDCARRVATAA